MKKGIIGEQGGEAQAKLAINAGWHHRVGEERRGSVYLGTGKQIDPERMHLKLEGERLPAGSVIAGDGAGMRVRSRERDKEMNDARSDGAGRGCGP